MRRLCVSGCTRLTDASLAALAAHCPALVTLELAQCSQLTDAGFQALARVGYGPLLIHYFCNVTITAVGLVIGTSLVISFCFLFHLLTRKFSLGF